MTWIKELFYIVRRFPLILIGVVVLPWRFVRNCDVGEPEFRNRIRTYTYFALSLFILLKAQSDLNWGDAEDAGPILSGILSNFWVLLLLGFGVMMFLMNLLAARFNKSETRQASLDDILNLVVPPFVSMLLITKFIQFLIFSFLTAIDRDSEALTECYTKTFNYICLWQENVVLQREAFFFDVIDKSVSFHLLLVISVGYIWMTSKNRGKGSDFHISDNKWIEVTGYLLIYLIAMYFLVSMALNSVGWKLW